METPETKPLSSNPRKKLSPVQVSLLVNVALGLLVITLCRVLPPIGDPSPLEAKFIEAGYLEAQISATQGAWWQAEIDQKDYNTKIDAEQVALSQKAEDLRDQLENLKTNEIPAYRSEDKTGAVPTADAMSASVTEVFQ